MIVQLTDDKRPAQRLVHTEYVRAGLMRSHPSGLRSTPELNSQSTKTIVAIKASKLIGTVSLVQDRPLPLEAAFSLSTPQFAGLKLVEVASLAVDHNERGREVLFSLFNYLVNYSIKYLDADELVITVNPRHIDLYESVFCFKRLGEVGSYGAVEGHPAICAHLNLRSAAQVWCERHKGKPDHLNVYKQFFEDNPKNLIYPLLPAAC